MRLRLFHSIALAGLLVTAPALAQTPPPPPPAPPVPPVPPARHYQGGNDQTARFSQTVTLGRQGAVTISNISGDIVVTGRSGGEVSIEAIKHGRTEAEARDVQVSVNTRPGRVEIRAEPGAGGGRGWGGFGGNHAAVDFKVTIPADASLDAHSVSGDIRITGVQGLVRAESVSGSIVAARTPHVERAKSVSGDVNLSDVSSDDDLSAGTVSGALHANGLKARSLDLNTVSGDVTIANVACDHVGIRSVSGSISYEGALARSGRYEMNSHSGDVRLVLQLTNGFELNASSFSGSIRSDVPLTIGGSDSGGAGRGDRAEGRRHGMGQTMHATYGDGSALLTVRTFSGDVTISKK